MSRKEIKTRYLANGSIVSLWEIPLGKNEYEYKATLTLEQKNLRDANDEYSKLVRIAQEQFS